jgi:NSS family neurotransmitter:Na+ symporter
MIAFFLLTSIAATTAMISMVEVPVAYLAEEKGMGRKKTVMIISTIIVLIGLVANLSADQASLLGGITIFGKRFFDLFDYVSSNILMPMGGLLIIIFVGYFAKKDDIIYELSNHGTLNNTGLINFFYFIARYITPALLIIVFLNSLGIINI